MTKVTDKKVVALNRSAPPFSLFASPLFVEYLQSLKVERVLVCGLQTKTCCLAAGFALFDAGLQPTLITDLTVGSSLDRTGGLGVRLWEHHFKHTVTLDEL
ncbi:hypothetical protein PS639_02039 [Pseudomonas fluorescens]|nr:cysteine hydrolase family protein [Pseudomonas fluorescens]VVM76372.1 hypothetical protein PS639_02039 [Pseudomonas fluorescens]